MYFKFIFSVFILDEPAAFYAEEIFESFEEFGTNDERLQRIFVLRSEVDLKSIEIAFKKMFGKKLEKILKEETSGNYRDLLLTMLTQARINLQE